MLLCIEFMAISAEFRHNCARYKDVLYITKTSHQNVYSKNTDMLLKCFVPLSLETVNIGYFFFKASINIKRL